MNSSSQRRATNTGLTTTKRRGSVGIKSRPQLVSLQVECFYGIDRDSEETAAAVARDEYGGTSSERRPPPVLTRSLRCRASLPIEVPLQSTSRVIAMLKCFRKVQPGVKGGATPMIETIFSKFTRVWPRDIDEEEPVVPSSPASQHALVVHDSTSTIDFTVLLASDLPQSLELSSGSIYYTMQIQANLRHPTNITAEAAIFSPEIKVEIPAPEAAYAAARLPKRITNGVMGQAQDHYGILISPDISLHVSIPREILYSRKLHSVFKIHIKLMPHPPESKLPGIAKLEWKLIQKTNLGSVQLDQRSSRRIGLSTASLASGQIMLPTQANAASGAAAGEEAMSGTRKDQYLYIALPENSPALLPQYDGNKYLEILHYLDIELFPAAELGGRSNNHFAKSAASFFNKTFSRARSGGGGTTQSANSSSSSNSKNQPWKASVPVKLYFDTTEIPRKSSVGSFAHSSDGKSKRLAITS